MAVTALVVAIIGAATGLGSLFWQFTTWKRSGWDLEVVAYWDSRRQEIIVEITNAGRQECVISEVRYFLEGTSDTPADFPDISLSDHGPLPASLAGSAQAVLTRSIPNIPKSFTLEVWVWTGGKPYKSEKYEVTDSAHHPVNPSDGYSRPADRGQLHSSNDTDHEGAGG
jgi:hypothetical protein